MVYITGKVFTCRSRLHRWIFDEGHEFPVDTTDRNVLIHVGPIVLPQEDGSWKLISFMPTSSIRFEKWGAKSVENWNLRMIIGKTTMGPETMDMMMKNKCVHVSPQCVSPNEWVDSIHISDVKLFKELGTIEATWHMDVNELGPFVVDIDCEGNNLFDALDDKIQERKLKAYDALNIPQDFEYTKLY